MVKILENVKYFIKGFLSAFKQQSTEYLEFEERELENVFTLLLMGAFVGIPSPPTTLVMRLMPHMVKEIYVMQQRVVDMDDIFGEISALFEIT